MGDLQGHLASSALGQRKAASAAVLTAAGANPLLKVRLLYTDEFGYIPVEERIEWTGGSIEPAPSFAEAVSWMEQEANRDGYLYPPIVHTRSLDVDGSSSKVPNSERPALLHRLPPTHLVNLDADGDEHSLRRGLAGFVVHFTGFLYGYRCQFFDWWVDGRVPLRPHNDYISLRPSDATLCLTRAVETWLSWSERDRMVANNVLFLHGRTTCYEWDWERFQAEYQVLDGAFSLVKTRFSRKQIPHKERIKVLCAEFGLLMDEERIDRIVRMRNELIHEALWGGASPLEAQGEPLAPVWLHNFNARLLLAIFGIRAQYTASAWWKLGRHVFLPV